LKESSDGEPLIAVDLWSSRGESTAPKVGFYPGNMHERLVVRYEVIEISWLLSGENQKLRRGD